MIMRTRTIVATKTIINDNQTNSTTGGIAVAEESTVDSRNSNDSGDNRYNEHDFQRDRVASKYRTIPHYLSATQARLEISSSNGGKLPALSVFQSVAERLADWQTSADHRIFLMRADGRS